MAWRLTRQLMMVPGSYWLAWQDTTDCTGQEEGGKLIAISQAQLTDQAQINKVYTCACLTVLTALPV